MPFGNQDILTGELFLQPHTPDKLIVICPCESTLKFQVVSMISIDKDSPSLKPTVLVVEDNTQFRQLVSDFLTFGGYRIISAVSGIEALAVLHQTDTIPDLIIADIIMKNMDGCEFLHTVRNQWGDVPFIMMSTSSTFEASCPGLTLKPGAYLAKPFSYAELLRVIEAILEP